MELSEVVTWTQGLSGSAQRLCEKISDGLVRPRSTRDDVINPLVVVQKDFEGGSVQKTHHLKVGLQHCELLREWNIMFALQLKGASTEEVVRCRRHEHSRAVQHVNNLVKGTCEYRDCSYPVPVVVEIGTSIPSKVGGVFD